jgi:outer membrane murein-binding lipoprotein Lpp
MKKTWLVAATAVTLLILGGCGNNSTDDGSAKTVEQLNSAISNNQFAKAQGLNLALINSGSKDGKKTIGSQLSYLSKAEDSIAVNKYGKALTQLSDAQDVTSSNKTLNKKITALIKSVKGKKADSDLATAAISTSRTKLEDNQYASALQALQPYLASKYQKPAFHVVYTKVLKLQSEILLAEQADSSSTDSTAKTTTTSKSTGSSESNSATNDNDNNYSTSSSSSSSSAAITSSDIAQARKDLTAAGEDQQTWSDGDIETAITNARKDGRTHIKASDLH